VEGSYAKVDPMAKSSSIPEQHAFLDRAKNYEFDEVKTLVESQPDLVYCQPGGRWSALHQFAACGNEQAVRFLLSKGASTTALTEDGRTPRDVAKTNVAPLLQKHNESSLALGQSSNLAKGYPGAGHKLQKQLALDQMTVDQILGLKGGPAQVAFFRQDIACSAILKTVENMVYFFSEYAEVMKFMGPETDEPVDFDVGNGNGTEDVLATRALFEATGGTKPSLKQTPTIRQLGETLWKEMRTQDAAFCFGYTSMGKLFQGRIFQGIHLLMKKQEVLNRKMQSDAPVAKDALQNMLKIPEVKQSLLDMSKSQTTLMEAARIFLHNITKTKHMGPRVEELVKRLEDSNMEITKLRTEMISSICMSVSPGLHRLFFELLPRLQTDCSDDKLQVADAVSSVLSSQGTALITQAMEKVSANRSWKELLETQEAQDAKQIVMEAAKNDLWKFAGGLAKKLAGQVAQSTVVKKAAQLSKLCRQVHKALEEEEQLFQMLQSSTPVARTESNSHLHELAEKMRPMSLKLSKMEDEYTEIKDELFKICQEHAAKDVQHVVAALDAKKQACPEHRCYCNCWNCGCRFVLRESFEVDNAIGVSPGS